MANRDITKVIEAIKKVVPAKHHAQLDSIRKSCDYSAPELSGLRWGELSNAVNEFLVDEDWKVKMVQILTDAEE